jgi:TRAP-type C4-dicarboxylate transport system substrate-binding protein
METLVRRRLVWPTLGIAVAVAVTGCASSHANTSPAAVAHYTDASDDGGGMPDLRRIDVTHTKSGTISFRVTVGGLKPNTKTNVDLWIDADANPDTGNTSFEGADGADYIVNAFIGQKVRCEPIGSTVPGGCISQFSATAGGWQPTHAPSTRITRTASSVDFAINRRDLGNSPDLNFFVFRGGKPFPDRAPGSGTFNYSLALGGPRPLTAPTTAEPASKAGGEAKQRPKVLKLATRDYSDPWSAQFAAAVDRLSAGGIRIDVRQGWRYYDLQAEPATIADLRHGDVALAVVGARAWDFVGVKGFDALVAPFLIDSLPLQARVLGSPLMERALEGVRPLGLVGLAVLPGGLRRPLGLSRPLRRPADYRGAKIGIRPAPIAAATFKTLGGTARGFDADPSGLIGFDGAESDVTTILNNRYDTHSKGLTANVVLWPRVTTLVANAKAFDALSPDEQQVLLRAGREALVPLNDSFAADQRDSLDALCRAKHLRLVLASDADRTELRRAVQPLYDRLRRDSWTRKLISEIEHMKTELGPVSRPLSCPTPANASHAALEGRWEANLTPRALRAAGEPPEVVDRLQGKWVLEFRNGRWSARSLDSGATLGGSYTVVGNRFRETVESCEPKGACHPGIVMEESWSVYRDRLSFERIPGHVPTPGLTAQAWARVR